LNGAGDERGIAEAGRIDLPVELEDVFREFRTCEFSTLARDGTPISWPLITQWQPQEGCFLLTTSIAMSRKALNVRRDGRVSLLFSDPTASGLQNPPAVLVQGDAEAPDEIHTSPNEAREYWIRTLKVQPAGKMYSANRLMRYLFDWYYMRLYIYVRPRRIFLWPEGDFARAPREIEVGRVV
jgi:general stress protein 26